MHEQLFAPLIPPIILRASYCLRLPAMLISLQTSSHPFYKFFSPPLAPFCELLQSYFLSSPSNKKILEFCFNMYHFVTGIKPPILMQNRLKPFLFLL